MRLPSPLRPTTTRQSRHRGTDCRRVRANAKSGITLQELRRQSDDKYTGLQEVHEQEGGDEQQDFSIFHGGRYGAVGGGWGEGYSTG